MLSDVDIKKALENGAITIEDFDENRLQPATYDVLLGNQFMTFDRHLTEAIDPKKPVDKFMNKIILDKKDDFFVLHPGEFALGVTHDFIGCDDEHCIEIMGKSSLARLGLIIHTTAGFIDPGNSLNITLELFNTNSLPIKLYPGMKIAQVAFYELSSKAAKPYGHKDLNSKYYGSREVQASQMNKNF
ncbi:dCTP deaminase [Candidatus Dojkabacteria bacterium]|uniref:dCTP deaminase, dUMP-forming n=1 Tax=Candidatus Dojkabacteria bacterium TaxID=2099670 RepID=A0A955L7D3_9BACT|nr:dCTP deaminase [Candidatus Dojkabacteria bacterium]